jgi:hypothetical protein
LKQEAGIKHFHISDNATPIFLVYKLLNCDCWGAVYAVCVELNSGRLRQFFDPTLERPILCFTRLKSCEFFVKFLVLQDNGIFH